MRLPRLFASLLLAFVVPACSATPSTPADDAGGLDAPGDGGGSGIDGGGPVDGGGGVDGGGVDGGTTESDGGSTADPDAPASDGGSNPGDACVPPVCPAPPPGCSYFGATACSCGTLECTPPTDPCEGAGTTPCRGNEYCAYDPGTCGGTGMCRPTPDLCPDLWAPVCACDGVTYSNPCEAAANGQSVAFDGECPPPPDCRTSGCPSGESCQACLAIGGINFVCLPDGAIC